MADLATITIPVDSSAMVRAVKDAKSLEGSIKLLTNALDSGVIGQKQFDAGLAQLEKQFKNLFKSADGATSSILGYVQSLRESKSATEAAAKSKNNLAMATKRAETAFALANQKAQEELQTLKNRAEFAWAMAMQRERESQAAVRAAEQQAKAEANLTAELLRQRNAVEQATRAKAQAAQAQIGSNLGLGARGISAGASASAIEGEIERLRQKYDQIYASSQLYEKSLNEINQAHRVGVLSVKQHEAAVESLNLEYQNFQSGIALAGNRFATHVNQTSTGMNKFGMAAQQTGYQVSDFLVQIQGGTNPLVAFSQQATQLTGLLYIMSPALLASRLSFVAFSLSMSTAIAGVTILVPLLAMLAMAFANSGKESDKTATSVDKQTQAYDALIAKVEQLRLARQTKATGITSTEEQVVQNNLNELLRQRTVLQERLNKLEDLGGRAAGYAKQAEDKKALLQTAIDQNAQAIKAITYEQQLEAAARRRANEKRNEYREAEALRIEEEKALELARRKKDAFHAMAGEMGAVSSAMFNANDGAASILSNLVGATNAAMGLRDALGQVESAAASRADRIASLTAQIAAASRGASVSAAQAQAETATQLSRTGASLDQIAAAAQNAGEQAKEIEKLEGSLKDLTKTSGGAAKGLKEAEKAAEALRKELEAPLVSAVGSVSDAFGDFVARGLTDFKGFVQSILASFQNMIAQMIAMAVKNRIMLSLGIGGITPTMAAAGQVAGLGSAGGMLGSLGIGKGMAGLAGGTGFLGGAGNAIAGLGGGGAGFLSVGANAAAAGGGALATIGAAIPVIAAVAAVFSFFKKSVKELDSGLRITVTNMDAFVETFKTIQTKRFWGLSKKVTTTVEEASTEISDPIVKAVVGIQEQVLKAAGVFGIAESAFSDFLYNFEVSLKGLTEEEKIKKVNEELVKMGDSFAALTGHFSTMNELLEAANQRMELQNRLDTLLGNNQAVLLRQREAEIAATHELNRPLLTAIFTLEDAKTKVDRAFTALRNAIDKTVEDLQKKLSVANEAVTRSRGIFQQLENALSGRVLRGSGSQFSMRRQSALGFLRRGDFSDERQLEEALGVVSEPTEDLYRSFEDYARDFYYTSGIIEDAKKIAEVQLTADEKQVALLEKQIADAQSQYDLMMQQYNELMGINEGVLGVKEAVIEVQKAIATLGKAMAAAQAAAAAGVAGGAAANVIKANTAGQKLIGEFGAAGTAIRKSDEAVFEKIVLKGDKQLLAAAADLGIKTSGKTGAQIQQEISNKGNLGVGLDSKTRAQKFAMGGMFGGGLRIVGEQGPELEATGPSRIFSNRQTSEMFRDPELTNSVTELKNEVSRMRSEQLQIQLEISKNTKRIYDTERKWDVDGLPATRT